MRNVVNNDNRLSVDAFRAGLEKGFVAAYNQFFPALCLYALRMTDDQAAAEDIVEEAFIKTWQRREGFFHIQVLKSYLYTSVKNASINWLKQSGRQKALQ